MKSYFGVYLNNPRPSCVSEKKFGTRVVASWRCLCLALVLAWIVYYKWMTSHQKTFAILTYFLCKNYAKKFVSRVRSAGDTAYTVHPLLSCWCDIPHKDCSYFAHQCSKTGCPSQPNIAITSHSRYLRKV